MRLWNTYYITTSQNDFSGPNDSTLYTSNGTPIASVPYAYARDLFVEGAGFLSDGRLVNVSGRCSFGDYFYVRQDIQGQQCYHVVNPRVAPWGYGTQGRPLVPLRTIAVDRSQRPIPYGTPVYIRQFDGLQIPSVQGTLGPRIGGFRHNGWFIAGDTGGAIGGDHIDIFAGNREMMRVLERLIPTRSSLDASIGGAPSTIGTALLALTAVGTGGYLLWRGVRDLRSPRPSLQPALRTNQSRRPNEGISECCMLRSIGF